MAYFKCSFAADISCYADFTIEAENEADADNKIKELLRRGCFDEVSPDVCWENGLENQRVFVSDETDTDDEPLLQLDGFNPTPEVLP